MTASMVTRVNAFSPAASKMSNDQPVQTDAFSKVFEQNQSYVQESKTNNEPAIKEQEELQSDVKEAATNETKVQNEGKVEKAEKDVTKVSEEEAKAEDVSEEESDPIAQLLAAQEAARKMQEAIVDVLQITPQQLEQVMEELGMEPGDLFDSANIQKLVIALTEGADEFSMMTDANLFANVKELMGIANEITQEFANQMDMEMTDAQNYLQQLTENPEEAPVQVVAEDAGVMEMTDEKEAVLENEAVQEEDGVLVKENLEIGNQPEKRETSKDHGNQPESQSFAQTVLENLKNAVQNTKEVQTMPYTTSTEQIMEQITQAVKLTMNQEMTEMELQLHPASLGNVRVQVAAKEGVITATFTTQNEMVKNALETQMVVLKDNFEAQGIKVEAVEVTVASHAFEQNLNGNANNQTGEEAHAEKKTARRIDLSKLTDESEEELLDEGDRIVADMMRKNGNTVDFTA